MNTRTCVALVALLGVAGMLPAQDSTAAEPPVALDTAAAAATPDGISGVPAEAPVTFSELAGELPTVVGRAGSPYLVTGDIIVAPGKTVTVEPGVSFLFRNFTGLQVHGTLTAAGTKEAPIAFTSEHDKKHGSRTNQDPAPYDWNGVTVTENAVGTKFEFCRVGYSLYGINAMTDYFTIKDCMFRQNGRADLTIKGTKQAVVAGTAFSYEPLGKMPTLAPARNPRKTVLQTSAVAVFVVGCAIGIWKAVDYANSRDEFETLNDASSVANLHNPDIVSDWENARSTRDTNLWYMIGGFGGAAVGATVFTISLF